MQQPRESQGYLPTADPRSTFHNTSDEIVG